MMIDHEDRRVLARGVILVMTCAIICLSIAAIAGASVVVFRLITGW